MSTQSLHFFSDREVVFAKLHSAFGGLRQSRLKNKWIERGHYYNTRSFIYGKEFCIIIFSCSSSQTLPLSRNLKNTKKDCFTVVASDSFCTNRTAMRRRRLIKKGLITGLVDESSCDYRQPEDHYRGRYVTRID